MIELEHSTWKKHHDQVGGSRKIQRFSQCHIAHKAINHTWNNQSYNLTMRRIKTPT